MLIVRKEQMDALDAQMLDSFFRRMAAHLRESFPAETSGWDDDRIRQFITAGAATARRYGVTAERDTAANTRLNLLKTSTPENMCVLFMQLKVK